MLFIYCWLCWTFVAASGPPPVAGSRASLSLPWAAAHCCGLSCGTRLWVGGFSCGARAELSRCMRGIVPGQGSDLCALHWQVDS